jgi:hypothetical protein
MGAGSDPATDVISTQRTVMLQEGLDALGPYTLREVNVTDHRRLKRPDFWCCEEAK